MCVLIYLIDVMIVSGIHVVKQNMPKRDNSVSQMQSYDPIQPVAEEISAETWLLCFDEFQVITLCLLFWCGRILVGGPMSRKTWFGVVTTIQLYNVLVWFFTRVIYKIRMLLNSTAIEDSKVFNSYISE